MATRLVTKFPAEDGRGVLVPVDNESDIVLVRDLRFRVGVEACRVPAVSIRVSVDTTQSIPIVEEGEDNLDAVCLGRGDDVVQTSNAFRRFSPQMFYESRGRHTCCRVVIDVLARGIESLIINPACRRRLVDVAKSPYPRHQEARLRGMCQLR